MPDMISFPHLGIRLEHVGRGFSLFGFEVAFYGIIVAAGMAAGIGLVLYLARRSGQDEDFYFTLALCSVTVGILGARLYYVAFSWDYYRRYPLEIFNLRGGGLAIYGGILAGTLFVFLYCRKKKQPLFAVLDTCIVGVPLGQAIGRWGNFFNREAFGAYTDAFTAMQLPLRAVNETDVTAEMLSHAVTEGGETFIRVHPTFLYESVWDLFVLLLLLLFTVKWKNRKRGMGFCLYLMLYAAGRFWIEGLRTDQLLIGGYPVSRLVSVVLFVCGLAGGYVLYKRGENI